MSPQGLGRIRIPRSRAGRQWSVGAEDLVTDEMVLSTTLIGTEGMVRERLSVWHDAGVDTVRLYPAGVTMENRLDNLGHAIDLRSTEVSG